MDELSLAVADTVLKQHGFVQSPGNSQIWKNQDRRVTHDRYGWYVYDEYHVERDAVIKSMSTFDEAVRATGQIFIDWAYQDSGSFIPRIVPGRLANKPARKLTL
jgi:hypothetical protein